MAYTKGDVQHHSEGFGRQAYPAVNVKVHHFPGLDDVREHFGCSERTAEKALEYAFESQQEAFWQFGLAQEAADEILAPPWARRDATYPPTEPLYKVYSEGRPGGWLIVPNLPPLDGWDAVQLAKWRRFENTIKAEVEYLCSQGAVFELIQMNEWALDEQALTRDITAGLQAIA